MTNAGDLWSVREKEDAAAVLVIVDIDVAVVVNIVVMVVMSNCQKSTAQALSATKASTTSLRAKLGTSWS